MFVENRYVFRESVPKTNRLAWLHIKPTFTIQAMVTIPDYLLTE